MVESRTPNAAQAPSPGPTPCSAAQPPSVSDAKDGADLDSPTGTVFEEGEWDDGRNVRSGVTNCGGLAGDAPQDADARGCLRILVCTGNLGNRCPSKESIAALLPRDGSVDQVIDSPSCPLPDGFEGPSHDDRGGRFDIIAIGLQEAVFNVKASGPRPNRSNSYNSQMSAMSEDSEMSAWNRESQSKDTPKRVGSTGDLLGKVSKAAASPILAVGNAATDALIKPAVTTVVSAAGSADHTKRGRASEMIGRKSSAGWVGGTKELYEFISAQLGPSNYRALVQFQRGEMRLVVLVREEIVPRVSKVDVFAENTGIAGIGANKGGIIATLTMADEIRLSFLTAHLEAHEGKEHYTNRCANLAEIFSGARNVLESRFDSSVTSHHMFVCGDLNFRVALPPPDGKKKWEGEAHREEVRAMVEKEDWAALNDADELRGALEKRDCLVGFETLPCHFHPTFKVERQKGFNYQEKRTPSYTDRILWKSAYGLKGSIRPLAYEPLAEFSTSDHKPVRGAFSVAIGRQGTAQKATPWRSRRARIGDGMESARLRHLHIFVSDMSCTDLPKMKQLSNQGNTPFIMFITDPKDLLRLQRSKSQMILDKLRIGSYSKKLNPKHGASKYKEGWLRTRVNRKGGSDPCWGDAEIHLMVRKPGVEGPADLEGAMLYMAVYDQQGADDVLIGTVALGLQELAKEKDGEIVHDAAISTGAFDMIDIDEPILKNGVERGRLTCTIVAWWLAPEQEGRNLGQRRSVYHRSSRPRTSRRGSRMIGLRLGRRKEN